MKQRSPAPDSQDLTAFSDFVKEMRPGQIAMGLFEALPDVIFWIKDRSYRFVFVNQAFAELWGKPPEYFFGKTDQEVNAPELTRVYRQDDEKVSLSGEGIHNKMELVTRRAGGVEWRMTSKIPLYDHEGVILGTAGVSRRLDQREGHPLPPPYRAISKLIDYVHEHVSEPLAVDQLAKLAGMSVSTLERRFRAHLGTSPKRFILHSKVAAACERLLSTPMTISEISESLGYNEHASFTRAFTSVMHMSPTAYRKYYKSGDH
ncbi:AraC family transcriptional regulator [Roseibacillus ishigakijimensis]|uniref:AraC family transcriptional regulator n=1 Tax=Roseibacillus ishigakijimensis TaxID=454146 RepID=A0A934RPH3_9BACT|nr:AraC family transcriptional regulator [Roseibacillus ishigakijimensis]MBK1833098.1 AraC family transcriptional regulator [Roseibacillus ishigakijimensis]